MAFGDEDLAFMCADVFSVPVVFGTSVTSGILGHADVLVTDGLGQPLEARTTTLSVPKTALEPGGALVGIAVEDAITVDGRPYRVRDLPDVADGRLVRIHLVEADA